MKRTQTKAFAFLVAFLICSCKKIDNFLEKAPGVDVTEDTIFSSQAQLDAFITTIYRYGIPSGLPQRGNNGLLSTTGTAGATYTLLAGATDEGNSETNFDNTYTTLNPGTVTAQNITTAEDPRYYIRWINVRQTNIVLQRLKEVPNLTDAYRKRVEGEVRFMRAMDYFEMVKRYGGVPLVSKSFNVGDEVNVPRSSVEDTFKFIVSDLDAAIPLLPDAVVSSEYGRVIKGAALLLKARALLYAASPLFNTAQPFQSLGANNKLICYGNYDQGRWQKAADAAKDVLTWANQNSGTCRLITDQGVTKNYKYSWETYDNPEIILAEQFQGATFPTVFPWYGLFPVCMGGSWTGMQVLQNFVEKYEKSDGTPQTWPATGTDLTTKYNQLDPRFKQTVAYNGSYWNAQFPNMALFVGGDQGRAAVGVFSGAWLKKFWPDALSTGSAAVRQVPIWIVLRLNEAYLDFAEAENEANGPTTDAYNAVNAIRNRSGMPNLPAGLSKEQFRQRVWNERAVELAFEDHRFYDVRRWLAADQDGVMRGNIYGLKITKNGTLFNWEKVLVETRNFQPNFYLHPFPYTEVLKGNLIQNPGW